MQLLLKSVLAIKFAHTRNSLFIILFLALLSACNFNKSNGAVISDPPAPVSDADREHAALAFISYTGELLEGSDDDVEKELTLCLQKELSLQPMTKNKYDLIWGPAVYKFAMAELDDNMMFVVRNTNKPSKLVISIRGTNADAILDWLVEDFEVTEKVKWPYKRSDSTLDPHLAEGTYKGLNILQTMTPAQGTPGQSETISAFLKHYVEQQKITSITVTGHSLGGALAPAFALWLNDTRPQWDRHQPITVSVVGLAGPSPGDKDFSLYYDRQLGKSTKRFHNPYDVAPLAWNSESMNTIPNLYKPSGIKSPLGVKFAVQLGIWLSEENQYTQQLPKFPSLSGGVNSSATSFLDQVGWQHTCGYYCNMQLLPMLKPVSKDCINFNPQPVCLICALNSPQQ